MHKPDESKIDYSKQLQKNFYVCDLKMGEDYKFVHTNIFFRIISWFLYILALIVLWPVTLIMYGLKVKGKKNLKNVKNAVFVSNHILEMDFVCMMCHCIFSKKPYILSLTNTFKVPVIRRLIKYFGAIPIPTDVKNSRAFLRQTDQMLKNGGSLIVFAEGSMWPYYNEIRPFKDGAFRFSVKNDVPVVPFCITLRKPNKFYRMFGRKKPLATIHILPPIYYDKELNKKDAEMKLKDDTYNAIKECFDKNSEDCGYVSKDVQRYFDELNNEEKEKAQ